ncbi:MAG: tetratricopeptide repeat protein [Bacteroidales bacterium]
MLPVTPSPPALPRKANLIIILMIFLWVLLLYGNTVLSHPVNVFLYLIASLITFYVLRRLLLNYNILFPVIITMLFMAHPVHTEVVASLKNRDEILAFLLGMAGMYTLMLYINTTRLLNILQTSIFFALACVASFSALPFIGLYLLVLYFFGKLRLRVFLSAAILIILAAFTVSFFSQLFFSYTPIASAYVENALYVEKSLWIRLGTSMMSLLFYLRILFYPYPLLYYYGYNMIPLTSLGSPLALLSFVFHALLIVYAMINIRSKSFLSFAILWYLIAIFIYSNLLFPVNGVVAERFVFTASLGFIMAVVFIIFKLFNAEPNSLTIEIDSRIKIIALVIIILIPSGLLTINRNADWRSEKSLFAHDIPHLDKSAKANYLYAQYLISSIRNDENFISYGTSDPLVRETIKEHLRLALKIYPESVNALNDLGDVFMSFENRYDSALYFFRKAVVVDRLFIPGWNNIGLANKQLGHYPQAIACYQKVLDIQPGNTKACFAIAQLYNELGNTDKARYYFDLGKRAAR